MCAKPLTPEESRVIKKEFLIKFPKFHCQIHLTCKDVGINVSTYREWRIKDPEFLAATDDAKEEFFDKVEYSLSRDAIKKGGTDRIFYMKTQMRKRGYADTEYLDPNADKANFRANQTDVDMVAEIKAQGAAEYKASLEKTDDNPNQ
jgi:hypothetical protein